MSSLDFAGRRSGHLERAAFDALYRRYAHQVYRFLLRRTGGDADMAEDALGIVFLEAWRRRGDVDLTSRPVMPWLYGVARNVLRNQRRSVRRREATLRRLGHAGLPRSDDVVSEHVERRQQMDALLHTLRTMPPAQREVVGLCLLDDRSYEAVAGTLEIPIGTVRSRLSRARGQLALAIRTAEGDLTTPPPPT